MAGEGFPIYLSGLPGVGKTTVGRVLAERLGVAFVDLDQLIEGELGTSLTSWLAANGEAAFRSVEADVAGRDFGSSVVALGGGTVLYGPTRRTLATQGWLVTLNAPLDVIARRITSSPRRALHGQGSDSQMRVYLEMLSELRSPIYAEAHFHCSTEPPVSDVVATLKERVVKRPPVLVRLGHESYPVFVEGNFDRTSELEINHSSPILLVRDSEITASAYRPSGLCEVSFSARKTVSAHQEIIDSAERYALDRGSWMIAEGGGSTSDVVTYAAATYLRGVSHGIFPTTLVGMVDAAIGGKGGLDTELGKNRVGVIRQPRWVYSDVGRLETLPARELLSGLGELIKTLWIGGEVALLSLECFSDSVTRPTEVKAQDWLPLIRVAAAIKGNIVSSDPLERGVRRVLNFGHTFGHLIEQSAAGTVTHGEAVALGMVLELHAMEQLGYDTQVAQLMQILSEVGLGKWMTAPWMRAFVHRLSTDLGKDKKIESRQLNLLVPMAPGSVTAVCQPPAELAFAATAALERMCVS